MTIPYPPLDQPSGWVCPVCGTAWGPNFDGPCTHQGDYMKDGPQTQVDRLTQQTIDNIETKLADQHSCAPAEAHRPGTTTRAAWACHQCGKWYSD